MTRVAGLERTAVGGLWALLLAPVIAQGLYRPLMHLTRSTGSAPTLTVVALIVAVVVVAAHRAVGPRARWAPAVIGSGVAAGGALGLGLGLAGLLALLGAAGAIAALVYWQAPRLPAAIDGLAARHRVSTTLYVLFALASIALTARLSTFMGDPTRLDLQMVPGNDFVETHSCLTAYVRALHLARTDTENLYHDDWWAGSHGLPPPATDTTKRYAPFDLDNFSYPPPFLLVASVLGPLDGDFYAQRAMWFALSGLLLALGLWIVARWIDGPHAHRTALLAPLFLGSLPVLVTLQIGNFHTVAMVGSMLAMVAFERGRHVSGGAALALTTLAKVSPGVLGIRLLVQRRYRSVLVTAGIGVLLLALTLICFGSGPIRAFVDYALPRLSSGRAFPFMDTPSGLLTNLSPFGIAFKLRFLGFEVGDPWRIGPHVGHLYTVALVFVAIVAARREGDRRDKAVRCLAILVLAALQSPFAPGYVILPLLWATTLLATEVRSGLGAAGLVFVWLMLIVVPPGLSPTVLVIQSMTQTVLLLGVSAWLAIRPAVSNRDQVRPLD